MYQANYKAAARGKKKIFRIFTLAVLWLCLAMPWLGSTTIHAQPVEIQTLVTPTDLGNSWKVHIGDNLDWSKPDFDDAAWTQTDIAAAWAKPYPNGFSWYRKAVRLPFNTAEN